MAKMNNIDSLHALFHLIIGNKSKEEILQIIRQRKINEDAQDERGNSLLHHAAQKGCILEIELLLELGVYTALRNEDGNIALEVLLKNIQNVNSKTIEIIQVLLECAVIDWEEDCMVDGIDNKLPCGKNFLEYAIENNDIKFAKLLIKCGAQEGINSKNKQGKNLLIQLIEAEGVREERIKRDLNLSTSRRISSTFDFAFIELLKARELKINDHDGCKLTALHQAISYSFDVKIIELLLKLGANVNVQEDDGVTPLHIAASLEGDNKRLINLLIDHGADINAKTIILGHDAIHVATKCNNIGSIRVLLKRGANIESQDNNQFTPLLTAIDSYLNLYKGETTNGPDVIKYLISENADIAAEDKNGQTCLFYLARANDLSVTKLLIDKYNGNRKKLINKKSKVGFDAVDIALEQDNKKFISLLISLGADVAEIDLSGRTRLHRAIIDDNTCEVELLLLLKANVNAKDNNGNTPLHIAIQEASSPKIVNMLLKKGANINFHNHNKLTPIDALCNKIKGTGNKYNEFTECFIQHIKEKYDKDYWRYFQLSGAICAAGVAYTLLFAGNLPLFVTVAVLFAGATMLFSCLGKWKNAESHYHKAEHRLKEVANEKIIATEASDEEGIKGNIDYNQNLHIPSQESKSAPSNKLEEVAIENIFQRQRIAE